MLYIKASDMRVLSVQVAAVAGVLIPLMGRYYENSASLG